MKDYKELIEILQSRVQLDKDLAPEYSDKAADAIESLVRERDHKDYMYKTEYRYRVKQEKQLSAIRAAIDAELSEEEHRVWHSHIGIRLRNWKTICDAINGESQPTDHIRDATKKVEQPAPANSDSREAFEQAAGTLGLILGFEGVSRYTEGERRGNYFDPVLESCWHVWQAALAWRDIQPQAEPVAYLDLERLPEKGMAYATQFKVNDRQSAMYTSQPPPEAVQEPDDMLLAYQKGVADGKASKPSAQVPEGTGNVYQKPCNCTGAPDCIHNTNQAMLNQSQEG